MATTAEEIADSHPIEENPNIQSYADNGNEFDPEVLKMLRLERIETAATKEEPEKLDVYQRMEKKGVPSVEVITDVEAYLAEQKISIEDAQKKTETNYQKYKIVESNLSAQKNKIKENEPEFETGRELLSKMKEALEDPDYEWPMEIQYPLAEQVFAKAFVDKFDAVSLVLGAGIFADVTLEKADEMFKKNLDDITRLTDQLDEEINFVKDQITTSEVNMAHLFNYNVQLKKAAAGLPDK